MPLHKIIESSAVRIAAIVKLDSSVAESLGQLRIVKRGNNFYCELCGFVISQSHLRYLPTCVPARANEHSVNHMESEEMRSKSSWAKPSSNIHDGMHWVGSLWRFPLFPAVSCFGMLPSVLFSCLPSSNPGVASLVYTSLTSNPIGSRPFHARPSWFLHGPQPAKENKEGQRGWVTLWTLGVTISRSPCGVKCEDGCSWVYFQVRGRMLVGLLPGANNHSRV